MAKRIAVFAKYGDLAASTRQRLLQYFPYLREAGFELEVFSLIDNDQLQRRFESRGGGMLARYAARMAQALAAKDYDLIWIYCELFPYLPSVFERLVGLAHVPIVYDYDDAIFHQYDSHRASVVRTMMGRKLEPGLRRASLVVTGNDYLASWARQFNDRVEILPTVVDAEAYRIDTEKQPQQLTIGWIGSPSTWTFVNQKLSVLQSVCAENNAVLKVVGAGSQVDRPGCVINKPWAESEEITDIQSMHVGIMPLDDSPFARGKCGYKLIQYMACGLPVVASPVGVNVDIVEHGVNGFLVQTDDEWREALRVLLTDRKLAQRMGQAGRLKVERNYSIQVTGPRLSSLFQRLA